ncbi:MAG: class I SAM-dependent methyltransferase [Gammaproteobacteria bacterium]|nr:class I SAM-dependent methyltransferase [Gammaproteobacteria bacterium]
MSKGITTKEYWDDYWGSGAPRFATYDKSRGVFHALDLLLAECLRRTRERLARDPLRLVDCGSGEGLILRFVHEQHPGVEVWGIEYSDAIEKSRQMAEELGYDFHLLRGDLFELCRPGVTEPFDVLTSFGLIEHFDDPGQVLAQLIQMVEPGGCVITVIPNFDGLFNALWKLYDPGNYRHHIPISNARLLAVHRELGLEDVALYPIGTPTIPAIHDAARSWQKKLNWVIEQVNGRILQPLWPRQVSLQRKYAMTPAVACVGWKPLP